MLGNFKMKILSVLFLLTIFVSKDITGQNKDSIYSVTIDVGGGFTRYVTLLPQIGLDKNSFHVTGRIMWKPEHLLSVGIESGFVPLFKLNANNYQSFFGSTDVELSLNAVPIFLTFGMDIFENFRLYAGVGGASLNSTADYFDNKVVSSSWTNAYELAASYMLPISSGLNLGGEFKWYNFSKIEDSALLLQIVLRYNLISY